MSHPSCTFNHCNKGLLEKRDSSSFTKSEKRHIQEYHKETTHHVVLDGVRFDFARKQSHNMSYVCECGAQLSCLGSLRIHIFGSEHTSSNRKPCFKIADAARDVKSNKERSSTTELPFATLVVPVGPQSVTSTNGPPINAVVEDLPNADLQNDQDPTCPIIDQVLAIDQEFNDDNNMQDVTHAEPAGNPPCADTPNNETAYDRQPSELDSIDIKSILEKNERAVHALRETLLKSQAEVEQLQETISALKNYRK